MFEQSGAMDGGTGLNMSVILDNAKSWFLNVALRVRSQSPPLAPDPVSQSLNRINHYRPITTQPSDRQLLEGTTLVQTGWIANSHAKRFVDPCPNLLMRHGNL